MSHDPDEYVENYEPCIRKTAGYFLAVSQGHLFACETDDRDANTDHDAERINSYPLEVLRSIQLVQASTLVDLPL
jgi:hypothetical protein